MIYDAVGRFKKASMNSFFLKYKKFLVPARRPSRPMLEVTCKLKEDS